MSLNISTLTEIGADAAELFGEIAELRKAGQDAKTDALEAKALALIAKAEAALEAAQEPGEGSTDDLVATLESQKAALEARLEAGTTLTERSSILAQLGDIGFKIFAVQIGKTLTWDRLLSAEELTGFRESLQMAANQVRRRTRLQRIANSIFSIFTVALRLASKLLMLL